MRGLVLVLLAGGLSCIGAAQTTTAPQTARQALIEMFFGTATNHLEKHLPEVTRRSFQKINSSDGQSFLAQFSMIATQAKASGNAFETFDSGPLLLTAEEPNSGHDQKIEITVERDDLAGEENQIELALHVIQNGKEETLPVVPRFTFSMKIEADVWRLNEIAVTVRLPLADPDFLKTIEDRQRSQNEQMVIFGLREVSSAERSYSAAQGKFACSLSELGRVTKQPDGHAVLYDRQIASGKKNGYIFVISECDGYHYRVVAEPAVPDSGGRAFCSNESGAVRASSDGKAATCLSSGEVVADAPASPDKITGVAVVQPAPTPAPGSVPHTDSGQSAPVITVQPSPRLALPQRVRVSSGVTQGLILSKAPPIYPEKAKAARIQGAVVMAVVIAKEGTVKSMQVLSSPSTLLSQAAVDAVRQWTYRPYVLNGSPVEVDTQVTVNFTLSQ